MSTDTHSVKPEVVTAAAYLDSIVDAVGLLRDEGPFTDEETETLRQIDRSVWAFLNGERS